MTFGWPVDFIGAAGATLTTLCWLPQAIKVIREKETLALSLPGTGAFTASVLLWLVYGVAIDDWPLIGSNGAILAMKLRHGAVLTPLANVRCVLIAWPCAGATACIWLSPRGSLS